jgi:RecJ-like exonuclease
MWQQCPQCKGSGTTFYLQKVCDVCNGAKIISQLTGLPPNKGMYVDSATSTLQSNFDNRDLSGTLDTKAFT